MATKSTIFKADLQVTDTDRDHYETHKLTLARHPSETDERLMVRLLVFALHADSALEFAGSISTEDTPALWKKNLSGEILEWIEIGQPDEKRIRKACGRAGEVFIYCYAANRAKPWWQGIKSSLDRLENLHVRFLRDDQIAPLTGMAERTMQLACVIQDNAATFSNKSHESTIEPEIWFEHKPAQGR